MKIGLFADAQSIHIRQLVHGLVDRGHTITVVSHKSAEIPGVSVERFRVPAPGITNPRRWTSRRLHYLKNFVRRFDVINMHFIQDWGFPIDLIERGCFVMTAWGSDIVDPPGETAADHELTSTRIALLQHATAVTTCGPTFASTVAKYGNIDVENIDVVPFGVNLNRFQPVDDSTIYSRQDKRIGFYKGFREVYNPIGLIRAIPYVLSRHPDARFEMIGDGPQLDACQSLADESSIDSAIDWIPRQSHDQIPHWLKRWNMAVIPSIHEAFGVAALEISAMRLGVVASDVCGLRDTVCHETTGLLTPVNDPHSLADSINTLLDDPELCHQMGSAGRSMVEQRFDWEQIYDPWITLYEKALDQATVMM